MSDKAVSTNEPLLPLQLLSRDYTPHESMSEWVQDVMLAAPTTHFVMLAQGDLIPWRRPRHGLDAIPRTGLDRSEFLWHRACTFPEDYWDGGVSHLAGWRAEKANGLVEYTDPS